jgi:hypothetical protein
MPLQPLRRLFQEWKQQADRSHLWRISRRLSKSRLRHEDDDELFVPDYFLRPEARGGALFLGFYSGEGIEYALREYGLWDLMVGQSTSGELVVAVQDTAERFHRLLISDARTGGVHTEIRASLEQREDGVWLYVNWILSQRPGAEFAAERPALPGQDHPGGGHGREILELLLIMGHRLGCVGVMGRPSHFHNAVMYRVHFRFEDPVVEGRFAAIRDAQRKAGLSLAAASWAIERGALRQGDEVVAWDPGLVLAPLVREAEFQDAAWLSAVDQARRGAQWRFDLQLVAFMEP